MSNFNHVGRAKQLISFQGMKRRSNLSPTDIDGFQEYNGRLFLYFEGKVVGAFQEPAQRSAFVSICESYEDDPKHFAWVLVFEHDTPINEEVVAKDQYVINVVSSVFPQWRTPQSDEVVPKFKLDSNGNITLLQAIEQIENWCHEHDILIGKERED